MKILLSGVSGSVDNIEEFMKKVDDNVGHMSSLPTNSSTLGQVGQVLKLTKVIMDRFSQVVHFQSLLANWLIEVIRYILYSMHRGPLFPGFTR
jgi:hypothetical protein